MKIFKLILTFFFFLLLLTPSWAESSIEEVRKICGLKGEAEYSKCVFENIKNIRSRSWKNYEQSKSDVIEKMTKEDKDGMANWAGEALGAIAIGTATGLAAKALTDSLSNVGRSGSYGQTPNGGTAIMTDGKTAVRLPNGNYSGWGSQIYSSSKVPLTFRSLYPGYPSGGP